MIALPSDACIVTSLVNQLAKIMQWKESQFFCHCSYTALPSVHSKDRTHNNEDHADSLAYHRLGSTFTFTGAIEKFLRRRRVGTGFRNLNSTGGEDVLYCVLISAAIRATPATAAHVYVRLDGVSASLSASCVGRIG